MKLLLFSFLSIIIFLSCTSNISQKSFCSWNSAEDYQRIPLLQPAELIRLNGDAFWSFPMERLEINNLNISTPMNVVKIGINKSSFILITDTIKQNGIDSYPSLVKIDKTLSKDTASIYFIKRQIDSIYNLNIIKYKWYIVKEIWNEFEKTGFTPWCQ